MGQPTGQPPRPAPPPDDLYRVPLFPQLYPPLGYAPDGTPLFVPGQQPGQTPSGDPIRPDDDPSEGSGPPESEPGANDAKGGRASASDRRLVAMVALVAIAALGLLALTVGRAALRGADQPAAQPNLPVVISELPTQPPIGDPATPDTPGIPARPVGKEVVYQVTASSPTTILYVDDVGLRTTVGAPASWTVTFTGTANPLRILVLAGQGEAMCSIKVDGRTVASDRISPDSPRRTVSCRA